MNRFYPNLFLPIRVKTKIYKNRIEASPMGVIPTHRFISSYPDYGGLNFYDKSIGGAASLHVISHGSDNYTKYVSNGANPFSKYQLDITQEQLSVGHQRGALVSICLGVDTFCNNQRIGPSNVVIGEHEFTEINTDKIHEMIDVVVSKSITAKKFGFDSILLDIAHDSPVALFMAPLFNKRSDEYGGCFNNRFRFAKELVSAVRAAVGNAFIIELRISATLQLEESYSFDEMLAFIKIIENEVDIVNVSSGMDELIEGNVHAVTMMFQPHLKNLDFAILIKKQCNVLVSLGGAIMTPDEAEEVLANKHADFVMLGRSLLADPFWPLKAQNGHTEDIVPCLRCNYCYHIATNHFQTMCSVNPRVYREKRVPLHLEKALISKRVAIIGGGPAGMKAALVANERGHKVDLFEKTDSLGGQLKITDYTGNHKIDLKRYKDYLLSQINKSDVNVCLSHEVKREELRQYDAVIIATGAQPIRPVIKGIDGVNVYDCLSVYKYLDKLEGNIVIIGGGSIGIELAIQLAEEGRDVFVIELSNELANTGNYLYKASMNHKLSKLNNLHVYINSSVKEITSGTVIFENNQESITIPRDNVVIACGMKSDDNIFDYYEIVDDTFMIGDCKRVGKVLEATNDAYFVASNL